MEQAYVYIKRLLVFLLCVFLYFFSIDFLSSYISLPILLLAFSILHSRITDEKPPHLFAFYRTDNYFKKGGLRDLVRIIVTLFGFLYDTIIWTLWGVYLIFILFLDLLDFLKTVIYWILHAILWIFLQYVPFIVFLYKIAIHYLFRWPWWLYQIAYYSIRYAYNKNCYRVAFWGTLQATLIVFLFYYLEVMVIEIPGISFIGIIIALLPLTWSFGEIANIRVQKLESEPFRNVKSKYQNGIESVRSILFYITLFVVLILAQLGMNLLGWIPQSGIPISGFVFNINTLITLILLFICILIFMGVIIIPSYRLYTPFSELKLSHTVHLLKTIAGKFLQYFIVEVPKFVFSVAVIFIPVLVLLFVSFMTYNLKNSVTDIKINKLKTEQAMTADPGIAYSIGKHVEHLEYLKQFPMFLPQELNLRKTLDTELNLAHEDIKTMQEELLRYSEEYKKRTSELEQEIEDAKKLTYNNKIEVLNARKDEMMEQFKTYETKKQLEINKLETDIEYLGVRIRQFPLLLFFGGIWLAIFGGMILTFLVAYSGNVYYQVFVFRNDDLPSEWSRVINQIRSKDAKQPLLGATLFIITAFLIYVVLMRTELLVTLINSIKSLFIL